MFSIIKDAPKAIVELMFKLGAVKISETNEFELSSGIMSPIYFDMDVLYSDVDARILLSSRVLFWINDQYNNVDAYVGILMGGIPLAAAITNSKLKPLLSVRKEPKRYGLKNQIGGDFPCDNAKVVVIDNEITTGESAIKAVEALRAGKDGKKADVLAIYTVIDWNFPSVNKLFEQAGIVKNSLITFGFLVEYGIKQNYISAKQANVIHKFYQQFSE